MEVNEIQNQNSSPCPSRRVFIWKGFMDHSLGTPKARKVMNSKLTWKYLDVNDYSDLFLGYVWDDNGLQM